MSPAPGPSTTAPCCTESSSMLSHGPEAAAASGREARGQPRFYGHSRMLRCAAPRISWASMRALDSLMPKARHSQTISIGPAGGSGQVHHREMNEYGPPPPANGDNTRQAGSVSRSGLPPPRRPAACCRRKTAGRTGMSAGTPPDHAARRAGAAGVVRAGPDPRGQEDPDPGGEGGQSGDRHGDLAGPRQQQGGGLDDAGNLRLRRLP